MFCILQIVLIGRNVQSPEDIYRAKESMRFLRNDQKYRRTLRNVLRPPPLQHRVILFTFPTPIFVKG